MKKIIVSNVLGCFVFSEKFQLIDSVAFETMSSFLERKKDEQELAKKHDAHQPSEAQLQHILHHFKKKEHFQRFAAQNVLLTKKAIRESVAEDGVLIQTVNAIEEMEKVQNLLTKRLREWYALYDPELESRLTHHETFLDAIQKTPENPDREGMGGNLTVKDIEQLRQFAASVYQLYVAKAEMEQYLEQLETKLCPNLLALAGPTIVAKLISHAGSLKRLAEMPASTLQVLGAEKALFRHLRNKKNLPPKHGLIHEHPLISKTSLKEHGKIARALADKLSMAARIDYYGGEFLGEQLKKDLIKKTGVSF